MRYVFYDFETSGTDLLDQILSFAFVSTNTKYQTDTQLVGTIKPNRTQWPHPRAILTNRLNLDDLSATGLSEWQAAETVYMFLQTLVKTHGSIVLIGYNNAHFDWEFLKSLFIRYGFSPYFMGKIAHVDLLYVTRHAYFQALASEKVPTKFDLLPLSTSENGRTYLSMTLENISHAFGLLDTTQQHNALEDVLLCIQLAKILETRYALTPKTVRYHTVASSQTWALYRQKCLHFADSPNTLEPYVWKYWIPLAQEKNGGLVLDLQKWIDQGYTQPLQAVKYTNQTRHDMLLELAPDDTPMMYQEAYHSALSTPELLTLTMDRYFETLPDWDIAYQLHALGFKRIDTLRYHICQLIKKPDSHIDTITRLWAERKDAKDIFMIQLLNRAYLEIHPAPALTHMMKYLNARYVTGHMYRNPENKPRLTDDIAWTEATLREADAEMRPVFEALLRYYRHFMSAFPQLS